MKAFIIFPNQLYEDISIFKAYDHVFLVEDPIYFNEICKPNKIKIAYLRAAAKHYFDNILKNKKTYIQCHDVKHYKFVDKYKEIWIHDPTDIDLMTKLKQKLREKLHVLPSPNFLMSPDNLSEYHNGIHPKAPRHSTFYNYVKSKINVLENTPNLDKYNRGPPPKSAKDIPQIHKYSMTKYYKEGIEYANSSLFKDHVGNPENVTLYPITHKDAYSHLHRFLKERLNMFGKYQDAILQDEVYMYHSAISPALNIGILDPMKVVSETMKYNGKVPIESLEGFIRQVIGWREFMRYLYIFHYEDLISSNIADNNKTFKDTNGWYKGETGILPIDKEIKKALETGYSHHIIRLMVFMNFFILCNVAPQVIQRWFMEVVSIDAYDWVMVSNIYAMGYFTKKAMSKPYISTSSYIIKMSDYKKDGHWDVLWDSLFYKFISSKPTEYVGAYARNLGYWKRNKGIEKTGEDYIRKNFK